MKNVSLSNLPKEITKSFVKIKRDINNKKALAEKKVSGFIDKKIREEGLELKNLSPIDAKRQIAKLEKKYKREINMIFQNSFRL